MLGRGCDIPTYNTVFFGPDAYEVVSERSPVV